MSGLALHAAPGWDDAFTAAQYERFCCAHDRYRVVNEALVRRARIGASHRVLDVGAGTGRTAEAALARLGPAGRILCVEPAAAMAGVGRSRLADPRVAWCAALPEAGARFDRILCGASVWLLGPLQESLPALAARLAPGGVLAFSIPALYLGEPDAPAGADDPLLVLPAGLRERRRGDAAAEAPTARADRSDPERPTPERPLPGRDGVETLAREAGLAARCVRVPLPLSRATYRDWLKLPPVSRGLWPDLPGEERARRLDEAFAGLDPGARRVESWLVWTAWRPSI
jgi:SAM-dependent methyltransferase